MVKFITAKSSITAVTAAALLAGLMAFLASAAPEAKAFSQSHNWVRRPTPKATASRPA